MNGAVKNKSSAKFEPPSTTSSATNAIKPPHQRSSKRRPRRVASQSRQGISIANGVAGRSGEGGADEQPAMRHADVEREPAEHDDDRHPAEPVAEPDGGEPEAELDTRVVRAIRIWRGTRAGGGVCRGPACALRLAQRSRK